MATVSKPESFLTPDITPESLYFTNHLGAKSGQTLEEFTQQFDLVKSIHLEGKARNFQHAVGVVKALNQVADDYELAFPMEPPLNRKVMNAIGFWHDSGEDEADSAQLFASFAKKLGFSPEESKTVELGILSTAECVNPGTREEKVVGIGDLFGLGNKDYAAVKARSKEYMEEDKEKKGDSFNETEYRKENLRRVANFLSKNFSLRGVELPWLTQAKTTYCLMVLEYAKDQGKQTSEIINDLGKKAIKLFSAGKKNLSDKLS